MHLKSWPTFLLLETKDLLALCCKKDIFFLGLPHDCYSHAHSIDWVSYTGRVYFYCHQ